MKLIVEISCKLNVYYNNHSSMELGDLDWMNEEAQSIIKDKIER